MKLSAYQGCTATKKSHENKRNNDEDNKCYDTGNEYLHLSQRSLSCHQFKAYPQGQGVFNRQFYSYEEVPHKQADEIIAAFKEKE